MFVGTTTVSTTTAGRMAARRILSPSSCNHVKLLLQQQQQHRFQHTVKNATSLSSPLILRATTSTTLHSSHDGDIAKTMIMIPRFNSVRCFSTPTKSAATTAFSTPVANDAATAVMRSNSTSAASAAASIVIDHYHNSTSPQQQQQQQQSQHPGTIEKPLRALDMSVVRQIKAELMSVDTNADGRLDATELKQLLRKHTQVFTDEEIVEIGELYYAAKAGGSVRFDNFIEAVDRVAAASLNEKNKQQQQQQQQQPPEVEVVVDTEEKSQHFRESSRHPLGVGRDVMEFWEMGKSHGHYTAHELDVKLTHVPPVGMRDRLAYNAVRAIRFLFDSATGWRNDNITVHNTLNRVIYLETIAAVPGMVAAIIRHFRSLRTMKGDGGMLQMFLEEANNERMHLLTFVRMKDPGYLFRAAVILGQFGFGSVFTLAYIVSPKFCHRFVGYVEEEACSTYTKIIKAIETAPEGSDLAKWRTEQPPRIACAYWKLGPQGTVLDLMKAVRADEAEHRDVNHLVSGMREGQINPLYDPEAKLDMMLRKYVKAIMTRDGRDAM